MGLPEPLPMAAKVCEDEGDTHNALESLPMALPGVAVDHLARPLSLVISIDLYRYLAIEMEGAGDGSGSEIYNRELNPKGCSEFNREGYAVMYAGAINETGRFHLDFGRIALGWRSRA